MIEEKSVLAIIPARGGSKGLPRKNIMELAGKPLIAWTIEAGLGSKYIDRLIVSTDDKEIAYLSSSYGADVPFIRPDHLATDASETYATIIHALGFFSERDIHFDLIIILQPTSPLRNSLHIDKAFELLTEKNADEIISVTEVAHSPLWSSELPGDKNMEKFISESIRHLKRRQDLPVYYRLNGAIYLVKVKNIIKEESIFISKNVFAYTMDRYSSVDIDDILDLKLAELIIKEKLIN